ncbi:glutamine--fructose-6-phosphate transaminase (isomerizing) [Acidicapsa acidisoli]|uniref:glutamine--fructose-6-phosphate transaminase (isomerizing) n=1 Tax=Acidicapsa acidisoli TaxID=1615681 RepID=UPI0021E05EA6|nr:glutamine--fructose-6-phosphate transaminase (isomerizing) [Acidicapsa acidisoli]
MCGIVGYVGSKEVVPVILEGLRRLEYRGYDSAGIAVGTEGQATLSVRRAPGKLRNIEQVLRDHPLHGTYGIGHTRWATHGRPTEENAHPHRDCTGRIVVVHNGIVENYLELKRELTAQGHVFVTETDTEIIAHLIEQIQKESSLQKESSAHSETAGAPSFDRSVGQGWVPTIPLEAAVRQAVKRLTGAFALGVLSSLEPDKIIAARFGPPVVLGIGEGEYFVASDVPGILHHTRNIVFLNDGEMAILTLGGVQITDFEGKSLPVKPQRILWDPIQAEKGGYKHFMLKEIWEQPRAIRDTTLGRISLDSGQVFLAEMGLKPEDLAQATSINIAACGTSWHAALAGKYIIERLARLPVEVDYASEYRYRGPIADPNALGLLITQSGETADTLAAQREMIALGSKTVAICNVVGAMITRDASGTIYTHAGPEIGVASTKAFTSQITALFLFALHLAQVRGQLTTAESMALVEELSRIPTKIEEMLKRISAQCEELARSFSHARDFLYLGRGIHFPIALEGALKLKEISYIHAEGYPAGEMKHGPNALIDETLPVVVLATQDHTDSGSRLRYEKTLSNVQEVTARSGRVIAIAVEGQEDIAQLVEHVISIPKAPELLLPLLEIVPLQLLAYHIAVRRGCDVDQPRNLAKSVTVE